MPLPRSLTAVPRDWHVHQEVAKAIQSLFAQIREQDAQQPSHPAVAIRERELVKLIARHIPHEFAPILHSELRKTGYDPNEPRVPGGNTEGGEWTRNDGSANSVVPAQDNWNPGAVYAANEPPGIGHNQGPPLDEPPKIPPQPPANTQAINDFLKAAARYLSRFPRDPRAAIFLAVCWRQNGCRTGSSPTLRHTLIRQRHGRSCSGMR